MGRKDLHTNLKRGHNVHVQFQMTFCHFAALKTYIVYTIIKSRGFLTNRQSFVVYLFICNTHNDYA